ncbi:hypothetical protein EDD52_101285 [Primorskyibacter sedentarius]|uniref:Uncharacterized protein n=2 Tax=Primorskyibacter sedentarius TaxID=745311 RepID=A0A4V2UPT6_9RHOB|nr:hypothetical protein EDD52_101285 [Primorskyibacter sedentarius]
MNAEEKHLEDLRSYLTSMAADILQTSDKKARIALGATANAVLGAAFVTTVTGAVGALGTASTGAAIAGLAGVAKSTATLYWIGGLVGGGVVAGTAVIGAGAVGVGIWGSVKARKAILGSGRISALNGTEQRIVLAIGALTKAIGEATDGCAPSVREVDLFVKIGVLPLLAEVETGLASGAFANMKVYRRVRLRGRVSNLSRLVGREKNVT